MLTGIITHTADFNGNAQEFQISEQWSLRVNEQFHSQYTEEGLLDIPQTPYLKDLDKKHILAQGEIGFIQFIVQPLWETLNQFLQGDLQIFVNRLEKNVLEWEIIQQANMPQQPETVQPSSVPDSNQKDKDQKSPTPIVINGRNSVQLNIASLVVEALNKEGGNNTDSDSSDDADQEDK